MCTYLLVNYTFSVRDLELYQMMYFGLNNYYRNLQPVFGLGANESTGRKLIKQPPDAGRSAKRPTLSDQLQLGALRKDAKREASQSAASYQTTQEALKEYKEENTLLAEATREYSHRDNEHTKLDRRKSSSAEWWDNFHRK